MIKLSDCYPFVFINDYFCTLKDSLAHLKKLVATLVLLLSYAVVTMAADKKFTLVIDAGHGGHDAGAVGAISKEKNINLKVALAFGRYVEQNCPDVRVVYTRKTDVFVTLNGRADIANKAKADLFVSVHTNAVERGYVKGFEVYTLGMHRAADNLDVAKRENSVITLESDYRSHYQGFDPNSSESYIMFEYMQDKNMENSVKLAKYIQRNVCSTASRQDKGVHQAGFLVLRETSMPSCLIELGFISTPEEERELNDPIVQNRIAYGIFQGFQNYRGKTVAALVQQEQPRQPTEVADTTCKAVEKSVPGQKPVQTVEQVAAEPNKVKPEEKTETKTTARNEAPVFKIQIVAASRRLKNNDATLKGLDNVDFYTEGGLFKYTYGASTNYNEIYSLRKQILDKFPEAFIIAFKNGEKTDVNRAIKEWKSNR